MSLIVDPSNIQQPQFNPKAGVSQFEFRAFVQQAQEIINSMAQNVHLMSIRMEALLKMATWCPAKLWQRAWEPGMPSMGHINLGEYYRYVDKMLQAYVPAVESVMSEGALLKRCALAKRWNDSSDNKDMPITADELHLAELLMQERAPFPTSEELDAIKALPQSSLFNEHWNLVLAAKAKQGSSEE